MKDFKPLLRLGGNTLINHAIDLFESVNIDEIVTVVGHRSDEMIPVVGKTRSRLIMNHNYRDGMFSSIQRGAAALRRSSDCFFLLPVDIPLIRPETIQELQAAFIREPSTLICYPGFESRRGHPPLIDNSLIDDILAYNGQGGLRAFLKKHRDKASTIHVADKYILKDIDTEEDLTLLQEEFSQC